MRAELACVKLVVPWPRSWEAAKGWLAEAQVGSRGWQSGQEMDIPIHVLRWSQANINNYFKDTSQTVFEACQELWMQWDSGVQAHLPRLEVVFCNDGKFWSLDNRRVAVYRMLQSLVGDVVLVPCCVYLLEQSSSAQFPRRILRAYWQKMKTENEGLGVVWSRSRSRSVSPQRSVSPVRGLTASASLGPTRQYRGRQNW